MIKNEFAGITDNITDPVPTPLMEKQFNNMIYVVSAIVMAVVLLNILRLYAFILSTRKKAIGVYTICGSTKLKVFLIYILEIIITMTVSFVIAVLLFHFALITPIDTLYPTFANIFGIKSYLLAFAVYMVIGLIFMTLNMIPLFYKNKPINRKE